MDVEKVLIKSYIGANSPPKNYSRDAVLGLSSGVKDVLREIVRAPDCESALEHLERFTQVYRARHPKAVDTLTKDQESTANVPRLPGGTQDPSADKQSYRIALCHRQSPDEEDQGRWILERRPGDDLQAVVVC